MTMNLIISTDSLNSPLTGIGYYTAHLVDEFLRNPEFSRIRGLSHAGIQREDELRRLLSNLTNGELGGAPHPATVTGGQNSAHGQRDGSHAQAQRTNSRLKTVVKKVPGAYTLARHWFAHKHKTAVKREMARERNLRWLVHGPNYIQPEYDGQSIITVHDLSHIRYPETHPRERVEWLNRHLPRAIDTAEKVICVSAFTRQELLDLGLLQDPAKAVVCYNGVDPSFHPRSHEQINGELEKWGLNHRGYILSVATLEPRKNLEKLLDAYESLNDDIAGNVPLVLVGAGGWKNDSLRQRIARIKPPRHVFMTGYLAREELQKLICGAGTFAYLSFYEGFGLPVLEAMASGTPVITANTTSLKEVAADAGYTVDPLDTSAIIAGLERLLTDKQFASGLIEKGIERAATFSWKLCAEDIINVYISVVGISSNHRAETMIPVILSGGSGSRLWPQSRKAYPKQFLPLIDPKHTLIQETAIRLEGLTSFPPLVVCNESHRFLVAEQLSQVGAAPDAILLEPCARNTAPAVALSALYAQKHYDDPVMLILPADHVIEDVATFQQSIKAGKEAAEKGLLVTFGIVPTRPETGYGYIESGPPKEGLKDTFSVNRFTEKPDLPTAEEFIVQGNYFWNSGMFMFRASTVITELREFSPKILHHCERALETASHDRDFTWVDQDAFSECPDDSIDYAVMEKTASSVVIPMDAGWSDVGSWQSLWEIKEKDMAGNAIQGEVIAIDSRNCLIQGGRRLVAAIGVDDLVIVESDDAVMVASKARSQDVKKLVEELESQGHSHHLSHRQIYRPWGHYDSIDQGDRFQVKRITVKPGEKLSLQMHHHRAEHWVVVRGTAKVTCGDKELLLSENQSTFIPLGTKHRLENPGKVDLEIIEVQSGAYLGEDDIVRFDDNYGRCE